jgi:hypothetical protein
MSGLRGQEGPFRNVRIERIKKQPGTILPRIPGCCRKKVAKSVMKRDALVDRGIPFFISRSGRGHGCEHSPGVHLGPEELQNVVRNHRCLRDFTLGLQQFESRELLGKVKGPPRQ